MPGTCAMLVLTEPLHAEQKMKTLGASWTDTSKDATHLVVKGISRTEKFLCSESRIPSEGLSHLLTEPLRRPSVCSQDRHAGLDLRLSRSQPSHR